MWGFIGWFILDILDLSYFDREQITKHPAINPLVY